jgi:hypothetical protein
MVRVVAVVADDAGIGAAAVGKLEDALELGLADLR